MSYTNSTGPNAFKVLRTLGLGDAFRGKAFEPTNRVSLKWDDGSFRSRVPFKGMHEAQYGAPYLTAHRADLHAVLPRGPRTLPGRRPPVARRSPTGHLRGPR